MGYESLGILLPNAYILYGWTSKYIMEKEKKLAQNNGIMKHISTTSAYYKSKHLEND